MNVYALILGTAHSLL